LPLTIATDPTNHPPQVKSTQPKDKFNIRHEKKLTKVYAAWDQKRDLVKPTKYWNGLLKADKEPIKPYMKDELMGEGGMVHNMCRIVDKKKPIKAGKFHAVKFWMVLFNGAVGRKMSSYNDPTAPKLQMFILRVCRTDLKEIFENMHGRRTQSCHDKTQLHGWLPGNF
jgi:hypothetical protein